MSKLVFHAQGLGGIEAGAAVRFMSTFVDQMRYAHRVGEKVVIADVIGGRVVWVALGTLAGFDADLSNRVTVEINDLDLLAEPMPLTIMVREPGTLSEVADADIQSALFPQSHAVADGEQVILSPDRVTVSQFTTQLERQQAGICSFSGVSTTDGVAVIIRPLDQGGRWHVSNFLYLDPEPAELFCNFAWTVAPGYRIVTDIHAMTADIASTVTLDGKLALSAALAPGPDHDALAWHFEQFMARRGQWV